MISGTITKTPNLCINPTPHRHQSPKSSSSLCFSPNSHYPKSPNAVFSPKSGRLRTNATISDEFVVSESVANLSFYQLLGISESGSGVEIKQAYKQLARKYHPDVSPPDRTDEYTKRFILVQEAYETLSDPNRKALYDRDMARGLHLAFSARKGYEEGFMEKNEWKNQWQSQVSELSKRRMNKNSNNMSWAAQMRRKKFESAETD